MHGFGREFPGALEERVAFDLCGVLGASDDFVEALHNLVLGELEVVSKNDALHLHLCTIESRPLDDALDDANDDGLDGKEEGDVRLLRRADAHPDGVGFEERG